MLASFVCEWPWYSQNPRGRYDLAAAYGCAFDRRIHRPWCARLDIVDGRVKYYFMRGHINFEKANGVGSRGVRMIFYLNSGEVYRCKRFVSSRRVEDDYIYVMPDGEVVTITKEEAMRCLGVK